MNEWGHNRSPRGPGLTRAMTDERAKHRGQENWGSCRPPPKTCWREGASGKGQTCRPLAAS